ncbi:MAG: phosphate ABC transporter permease PstA [Desulfobulbaceae bacterium]|nr:phosphate ABC transporter permease PstA [Desulfobulbaceae bacterium]
MTKKFWRQGEPYVWATGLSLSLILMLTFLLVYVVMANGIGVFWPNRIALATLKDNSFVLGEIIQENIKPATGQKRLQFKIGNRDLYDLDFKWFNAEDIAAITYPPRAYLLERQEYGNFYGFLNQLELNGLARPDLNDKLEPLEAALKSIEPLQDEITALNSRIAEINQRIETIQRKQARLRHQGKAEDRQTGPLAARDQELQADFTKVVAELNRKKQELLQFEAVFADANGLIKRIPLVEIVRAIQPNTMNIFAKTGYYIERLRELFFAEPRESNTEGGLFPAIFGTIMLIFLMSVLSFPLGVIGGIYLREYAKDGILVRMVRIAVNNLAGIPSIVYGIFGLGFFVYGIGGQIDQLFFAERLPAPTFGTGGILWASLTLGLLTVPVVIVATEEALGAIPPGIREGSQALAATRFQTLTRLLLPMASPGILTGFILAMARAAGEVAPLMITGVVKLAPALPIDSSFPFLHLNRKFMHLGFHIYDIGFQSPNVEAAKPMVYVTTLLLILIVLIMTSTAIYLRNKMRARYSVIDV